jgi:hypothetical protein
VNAFRQFSMRDLSDGGLYQGRVAITQLQLHECAKANRITRKSACKLLIHHSLRGHSIFLTAEAFVQAHLVVRVNAAKP